MPLLLRNRGMFSDDGLSLQSSTLNKADFARLFTPSEMFKPNPKNCLVSAVADAAEADGKSPELARLERELSMISYPDDDADLQAERRRKAFKRERRESLRIFPEFVGKSQNPGESEDMPKQNPFDDPFFRISVREAVRVAVVESIRAATTRHESMQKMSPRTRGSYRGYAKASIEKMARGMFVTRLRSELQLIHRRDPDSAWASVYEHLVSVKNWAKPGVLADIVSGPYIGSWDADKTIRDMRRVVKQANDQAQSELAIETDASFEKMEEAIAEVKSLGATAVRINEKGDQLLADFVKLAETLSQSSAG